MKIVPILKKFSSIYAVVFNGDDELNKAFDLWNDVEYLTAFFEKNKHDLNLYGAGISQIDTAVEKTLLEAEMLENRILRIVETAGESFDKFFKPLDRVVPIHQKSKAYGLKRRSWLRLYAVRINPDLYVISGSAIKLTQKMQDRVHTSKELVKLNRVRDYLKEEGLFSDSDFKYLES
ncbi:MAG: hypothetical protein WD491_11465 [Balneolales bacterium]